MFVPRIVESESAPPQRSAVGSQRRSQIAVTQRQLLQRTFGSQAMLRLLAQRARAAQNDPGAQRDEDSAALMTGREAAPQWDLSKIPGSSTGRVERFQRAPQFPGGLL
jgi:hypothetical protein